MPRVAALLHGFLRTGASMLWVGRALRQAGYAHVLAPTFAYQFGTLDQHADRAARLLRAFADRHPDADLDLVTHSYGGVLARAALVRPDAPAVRRLVMLGPPNQGAQWAHHIRSKIPLHHTGWDPLGQFLPGVPASHPVPEVEFGILAGGRGTPRGYNPFLDGDNDGTVTVDEARLDGAADFHVIEVHHSFLPLAPASMRQVVRFLDEGRFERD